MLEENPNIEILGNLFSGLQKIEDENKEIVGLSDITEVAQEINYKLAISTMMGINLTQLKELDVNLPPEGISYLPEGLNEPIIFGREEDVPEEKTPVSLEDFAARLGFSPRGPIEIQ